MYFFIYDEMSPLICSGTRFQPNSGMNSHEIFNRIFSNAGGIEVKHMQLTDCRAIGFSDSKLD